MTQRYNAKARGSKAGESAHKKRKRRPNVQPEDEAGSHTQANEEEQDGIDRRGMSSKKRKRLDSYIVRPPRSCIRPICTHDPGKEAQK